MTHVLITGGAGFIGGHIADALLRDGHDVRLLDDLHPAAHAPDRAPEIPEGAQWLPGDVRDPATVARALEGVDVVCHQAAMVGLGTDIGDIVEYVSHNDVGTAVLLRELARARFGGRVVQASSMVVYGEGRYRCAEHGVVRKARRDGLAQQRRQRTLALRQTGALEHVEDCHLLDDKRRPGRGARRLGNCLLHLRRRRRMIDHDGQIAQGRREQAEV